MESLKESEHVPETDAKEKYRENGVEGNNQNEAIEKVGDKTSINPDNDGENIEEPKVDGKPDCLKLSDNHKD